MCVACVRHRTVQYRLCPVWYHRQSRRLRTAGQGKAASSEGSIQPPNLHRPISMHLGALFPSAPARGPLHTLPSTAPTTTTIHTHARARPRPGLALRSRADAWRCIAVMMSWLSREATYVAARLPPLRMKTALSVATWAGRQWRFEVGVGVGVLAWWWWWWCVWGGGGDGQQAQDQTRGLPLQCRSLDVMMMRGKRMQASLVGQSVGQVRSTKAPTASPAGRGSSQEPSATSQATTLHATPVPTHARIST